MSQVEAVIFDCDGVMFDSRNANLTFYNRVLEHFSYPLITTDNKELAHLCHTASAPVVMETLLHENDLQLALKFAATLDYREFIYKMEPEPNLLVVLKRLFSKYPLAIATNRGDSIIPILDHFSLREYFTVVVSSLDVVRPKPAPDMLFLAAEKLMLEPENCLFIGDSILDKSAAVEAKVPFVGYGGVSGKISLTNHLELLNYLKI